jgi:hypothetical protein
LAVEQAKYTDRFNINFFPELQKRIQTIKFVLSCPRQGLKTALWPVIDSKYVRYSEIKSVNDICSTAQRAVMGPVQLNNDPSH